MSREIDNETSRQNFIDETDASDDRIAEQGNTRSHHHVLLTMLRQDSMLVITVFVSEGLFGQMTVVMQ